MHVVDKPTILPGHCIVNFSSEEIPGGYIDTLNTVASIDPRVYVSRQAVIDMGRLFGFPDPAEFEALRAAKEQLEHEVSLLKDQLAEADRLVDAAEYTFERLGGTKLRHRPGPKPKAER